MFLNPMKIPSALEYEGKATAVASYRGCPGFRQVGHALRARWRDPRRPSQGNIFILSGAAQGGIRNFPEMP
jgi:hypothetical protein